MQKGGFMAVNISIPNITRDDRIGSAFNHLFDVIHQTEQQDNDIEWSFKETMFLHPFFIAPLAIYKANSKKNILCTDLHQNIKEYFDTIYFQKVFDASNLHNQAALSKYIEKSYIPISCFPIKCEQVDHIQEILQSIIEKQSRVAENMRSPISYLLSELVGNIGEHSNSPSGYLFCQRVKQELYIVIADIGKTIYGSYIDTGKYTDIIGTDEAQAVKIANDGYSTKDRPEVENRGYGISKSRDIVVNGLGGAFFLLSGTAFYRHDANGAICVNIPEEYRWDGTIALIRIPTEAPEGFDIYKHLE